MTQQTKATLWLIDDDPALRLILADTFSDAGLEVVAFTQAKAAWTRLNDVIQKKEPKDVLPAVILTDIRMPMMDGLSFSDWVHKQFPDLPIVIMTAHSDLQSAVDSYQTGAFDYLPKPFDLDDAVAIIKKAIASNKNFTAAPPQAATETELKTKNNNETATTETAKNKATKAENTKHRANSSTGSNTNASSRTSASANQPQTNSPKATAAGNDKKASAANRTASNATNQTPENSSATPDTPNGIIGQSVAMQTVFRAIGRLSHSPITVLITGESGTGKELVANALHQHSPRKDKSFIALNMAAIPHDLIESELFGHEKGAFTGATAQRQGRFEQANGGTLFLDEIGDMPFSTQTRLLRVLANGEFFRVGGQKPIKVDVRIIAATHQDLESLVKQGKFREDLFYRLNVIRLPLPPLRQRREDIPALANHFMRSAAKEMATEQKHLHPDALAIMQRYDWSGNVRQLENACRWLTVMATGDTVLMDDLPPELQTFMLQLQQASSVSGVSNAPNSHSAFPDAGVNTGLDTGINTAAASHAHAIDSINGSSHTSNTDANHLAEHPTGISSPQPPYSQPSYPQQQNPSIYNGINSGHQTSSQPQANAAMLTAPAAHSANDWKLALHHWVSAALSDGKSDILDTALPDFETIMINAALAHTHGRKGDAAELLGWGRNTLTRKLQQLGLDEKW